MSNEVWKLELYIDEFGSDEQGIYGYYSNEKLAWKYALYFFNFYSDYRIHKTYDKEKDKWVFWYYTSMYKRFTVTKLNVKDKFEEM